MHPFIHESGNKHAVELAKKAEEAGLTTMFNTDPKVSVDTFDFYKKYDFFHPDTNKDDENAFATLVRECVHFEVETAASMLTFGLDLKLVYPQVIVSYMFKSCRASLKDRYKDKGVDDSVAEVFARDLVEQVYNFIKPKLDLPDMTWQGASANLL